MSNDTDATVAAMKTIGEGVAKVVDDATKTLTAFGVEFNCACENAAHEQAARVVRSLAKR